MGEKFKVNVYHLSISAVELGLDALLPRDRAPNLALREKLSMHIHIHPVVQQQRLIFLRKGNCSSNRER
jgi:hypothetical protein